MRDLLSLIPFRPLAKGERPSYERQHPLPHAAEMAALAEAQEGPTVDEVRENWTQAYNDQTALLDTITNELAAAIEIVDEARNLMRVIALRGRGGVPLFTVNETATQAEQAALQHAVLALQARLAGEEVPALVTFGVKH